MREMVRQQVSRMALESRDAELPDDEFMSDDEFDDARELYDSPLSDYQLAELGHDLDTMITREGVEGESFETSVAMNAPNDPPGDQPADADFQSAQTKALDST